MIYSQDAWDGHPKYVVNQLAILPDGSWVLPFGSTAPGYPQTAGSAGLLISSDYGHSWSESSTLSIPPKPNISAILEPAISPDGSVVLLRSANGFLYESSLVLTSGKPAWSTPVATSLMNPNSRPSLSGVPGGELILASNDDNSGIERWPAWGDRSLLTLQVRTRAGSGFVWKQLALLEKNDGVKHCYPSVVHSNGMLVTAYSVYDQNVPRIGIKVARVAAARP